MKNSVFVVNKEPYCIWEVDVGERNRGFLNGIDPGYFSYLVEINLNSDDEKRAAIALRAAFHHALETLFSLIGAYVQAPDCAYAWIAKCSNNQLRKFVDNVSKGGSALFTKFNIDNVTLDEISRCVFASYYPVTEKNKRSVSLFSELWCRLAYEFLNDAHVDEYNSIKHGFRVRSGGFSLAFGLENEYGVSPPPDEMKWMGRSEHGTTIIKLEAISSSKGERSYRSKQHSLNWSVEKTALLLQLVAMSINNVTSALRILNGAEDGNCKFMRPIKDDDFSAPWEYSTGVISSSISYVINHDESMTTSKEQLQKHVDRCMQRKMYK